MLFPLDKSFGSTRFYQSGGVHAEVVRHRPYTIDHTGSTERVLELHRLLTEQKPFKAHTQLIQKRADEGRQRDVECWREHKNNILAVQARLDEQADAERREQQRRMREFRERRSKSDTALSSTLKAQHEEYTHWRTEMQEKVRNIPALGSDPIPREDPSRAAARLEAKKKMKERAQQYAETQQKLKETLDNRTPAVPIVQMEQRDLIIEKKKASGLSQLSKQHREYEAQVQELYDKHEERKRNNLNETRSAIVENNQRKQELLSMTLGSRKDTMLRSKEEIAAIKDRVNSRQKGFAGYNPTHKSDKRLRHEAAHRDIATSTTQRTLSPQTLGRASG